MNITPLREQGWHLSGSHIRNAKGQCPLCAVVTLKSGKPGMYLAFAVAIARAADDDFSPAEVNRSVAAAIPIARAADGTGTFVRKALLTIFGLSETEGLTPPKNPGIINP